MESFFSFFYVYVPVYEFYTQGRKPLEATVASDPAQNYFYYALLSILRWIDCEIWTNFVRYVEQMLILRCDESWFFDRHESWLQEQELWRHFNEPYFLILFNRRETRA